MEKTLYMFRAVIDMDCQLNGKSKKNTKKIKKTKMKYQLLSLEKSADLLLKSG